MEIILTTLNMYTLSLLAIPIGVISAYMKSLLIFLVMMEALFVVGAILTLYQIWFPVAFALPTVMGLYEEYGGKK